MDLGLAAKVWSCLVISVPTEDADRSLVSLVPHTTSIRDSRFEVATTMRFLKPGAFDEQGLVTVPLPRLVRRLGALTARQLHEVEQAVSYWLGLGGGG